MWLCRWLVELALWLLCGFIVLPLQDADRMKAILFIPSESGWEAQHALQAPATMNT